MATVDDKVVIITLLDVIGDQVMESAIQVGDTRVVIDLERTYRAK